MSDGPSYQSMFSERLTTLSPWSAEIGMISRSGIDSLVAKEVNSWWILSKTFSSKSTRSILLTASTRCGTRSSERITAWRRDCSVRPCRASTSTRPRSAVEAPVTMLRVYCTWPGVSAMMNLRCGVAK